MADFINALSNVKTKSINTRNKKSDNYRQQTVDKTTWAPIKMWYQEFGKGK